MALTIAQPASVAAGPLIALAQPSDFKRGPDRHNACSAIVFSPMVVRGHAMSNVDIVLSVLIVCLAGVVRGVTGFGGAMVMSPMLALLIGPQAAVLTALLLEGFAPLPLLPSAARMANWKVMRPIIAAAFVTAPLGGQLLAHVEASLMRKAIAVVVLSFVLVMLFGVRIRVRASSGARVGIGALGGVLVGATSMGGPPVILYLMASGETLPVLRANLMVYVVAASFAGLAAMSITNVVDPKTVLMAITLAPVYLVSAWFGGRLFRYVNERLFHRVTLLLITFSAAILIVA